MPRFNINLAKGIIWSRRKRLLVYRFLIVYFFTVALLLISMAGQAVQKTYEGIQHYQKGREIEREFSQLHPASSDLIGHARELHEQLEKDAARVESINNALPPAIHTPLPALVLLANQPGSMLHKFSFTQQTESKPVTLRFDVITPANSSGASSSRVFLDKWKNDPVLAQQFPEIRQLQVRRAELASGPVFITQYEALSKD